MSHKPLKVPKIVGQTNIGLLKPAYSAALTFHGHPNDQIVSCLQKYIRRGLTQKALYCALDIDLFSQIYKLPPDYTLYVTEKGGKAVTVADAIKLVKAKRTNLVNRMLVICLEDIGLASPSTVLEFEKFRQQWVASRELADQSSARQALIKMVSLLSETPRKSRTVSDIKSTYFVPSMWNLIKSNKAWEKYYLPPNPQAGIGSRYYNLVFDTKQPLTLLIDGLITELKAGSYYIFYWQSLLISAVGEEIAMNIVFQIIKDYAREGYKIWVGGSTPNADDLTHLKDDKLSATLAIIASKDYYGHFKSSDHDKEIFQIYPVLLALRIRALGWDFNQLGADKLQMITMGDVTDLYNQHMQQPPMVIEDFCIDQHTLKGRSSGKNAFDFLTTGSHVENQEDRVVVADFRQIYGFVKITAPAPRGIGLAPDSAEAQALFETLGIKYNTSMTTANPAPKKIVIKRPVGDTDTATAQTVAPPKMVLLKKQSTPPKMMLKKRVQSIASEPAGSPQADTNWTEKTRFVNPVRAQLTCSAAKQDVYFAIDKKTNRRVVVKGPYNPTSNDHKFAYLINQVKDFFPRIHKVQMSLDYLKMDQWDSVPLGIRNKFLAGGIDSGDFIVMEDLCHRDLPLTVTLPSMQKGSTVWADTTLVYDSSSDISNCGSLDMVRINGGGFKSPDRFRVDVLLTYIFRYIWEITDTCDRNFVVDYDREMVFSIDEDNFFAGERKYLTGNRPPPLKGGQNTIFSSWLVKYKSELVSQMNLWRQQIQHNKEEITALMSQIGFGQTWFQTVTLNIDKVLGMLAV